MLSPSLFLLPVQNQYEALLLLMIFHRLIAVYSSNHSLAAEAISYKRVNGETSPHKVIFVRKPKSQYAVAHSANIKTLEALTYFVYDYA